MSLRFWRLAFGTRGLDRIVGRMRHRVLGHGLAGERSGLAASPPPRRPRRRHATAALARALGWFRALPLGHARLAGLAGLGGLAFGGGLVVLDGLVPIFFFTKGTTVVDWAASALACSTVCTCSPRSMMNDCWPVTVGSAVMVSSS